MNKHQSEIESISKTIAQLETLKQKLEFDGSLLNSVMKLGKGTWVIFKETNTYYQFSHFNGKLNQVNLERHNNTLLFNGTNFENNFRLATPSEVQQHETYLASTGKPKMRIASSVETKKLYRLKPQYRGNEEGLAVLLKIRTFPQDFEEGSPIANQIVKLNLLEWFETFQPVTASTTIDPFKCEFYMVTCRGIKGSVVRHTTYDEAVKEAKRIAKREDHPTWVLGVVAKINP
jgi:hypothetical protein